MRFLRPLRVGATAGAALFAMLGLTGYTINSSNQITWTYLGQTSSTPSPYTSAGVPSHSEFTLNAFPSALPVTMPSNLIPRISLMLPERQDIRTNSQVFLSNDDQTNIKLTADADVWVTFLNEGAGFLNSIGFFTFDPNHPPLSPTDVTSEKIIIPNASIPPLQVAGTQGSTIHLGHFTASSSSPLGIGYFVVANGWSTTGRKIGSSNVPGVKENQDRNWIYYSLKGLNPEPATGNLNQHTILLKDQSVLGTDGNNYERLILGFEDYLRTAGSDHDFNDVLMAVHVGPDIAIGNLSGLPTMVSSTADVDTDGDGVKDSVDEFPNDANKAFSNWYPGSSSWGTLVYEDLWPSKGDYDFNDLTIRYRDREVLSASRLVAGIEMDLVLAARGATYHSGFALGLPGVSTSQIKSAYLLMPDGVTKQTLTPMAGQANAVFQIFADAFDWLPNDSTATGDCAMYYNTAQDCAIRPTVPFKLYVDLNTPTASFPTAPYDPFLFRAINGGVGSSNNPYALEVHLPGKQPTTLADTTLFGTQDDASVLGTAKTYMTSTGLPWAIDIPYMWDYPREGIDVGRVYPGIGAWAASGGTTNKTWYVTPLDPSLTFRNGR